MDRGFNEAIDKGVWQAGIGHSEHGPATTEEQAKAALPAGWELVGAEDAEFGVWLVIPSEPVRERLDDGEDFYETDAAGWTIEISQP